MLPTNIRYLYVCPAVGSTCADTMADMNMSANDVRAEQAPAIAPPTRTDDQILPSSKWVPIGKSNCILDLDEQWFNLYKDILRDALDITPSNDNNPFVAPPSSDTIIEYVNTLEYPYTLRDVSAMSVNALYQPWRAILSMIKMCLTSKTAGYDRPRHPVLQILWGITHGSNIDYAERIWEEFFQSIQTFLTDRKNLATASRGNKKIAHLLIPNVRFTKLIIHHLKNKHNIHPRPGSALHYSHEENILNTLRYVGKDGMEIFGMSILDALLTDAIKSAPYYSSYLEHVTEYQHYLNEEHDKADDKSTKPASSQQPKPTPTPAESSKKDQGKKRKLVMESIDAPSLAKQSKAGKVSKKRMPKSSLQLIDEVVDEGVPEKEPTHDDEEKNSTASIDVELTLTNSETESEEEVLVIKAGDQDEGQARPNPDEEFTTTAYPNVQENLKLLTEDQVILEEPASSTRTLSSLQNLDKDLSFTNQFFVEKPREKEPGKTNAEAEVQSMVSVPIHQDTSSVPLMTTSVIDLTKSQSDSPLPTSTSTTSTITTTTLPPPPLQSTIDPILVRRIGELEQHIVDLIQNNLALEERLDKHGSRLYKLENLNIPHQVSKAVNEIVTNAVTGQYKLHFEPTLGICPPLIRRKLFNNGLELDYSNQHLANQEEARKKKRKRRELPRTPPGSLTTQPPPPPPPAGVSSAPGSQASSSSKTAASALQSMAWTPSDTQYESADIPGAQELSPTDYLMQDDSIPKELWKPLPEEERPATPEPAWTIPSSNKSDVVNNWASALATTYEPLAENSLLVKIGDMTTFLKCLLSRCHSPSVPNGGVSQDAHSSGDVTIQPQFFFNKDLVYLRYGSKGSNPALSISKMKAASYLDFGLELLVPEQMWIDDVCTYDISAKYGISHWWFTRQKFYIDRHNSPSRQKDVRTHMRILCVVRIKAYSRYGYDYLSEIVLRRADHQEHMIDEKDFKNMYPSDFE
ncbi:hypothetical protein Tco_1290584, partial [Tanacetum coccineum]